jgi:hypothetical protein
LNKDTPSQYAELVAWQHVKQHTNKLERSFKELSEENKQEEKSTSFRDFYVSMLTDSFQEELNQLREEEVSNERKLSILVKSLEMGLNLFAEDEKLLLVEQFARKKQ